jgi:hypothetical protein
MPIPAFHWRLSDVHSSDEQSSCAFGLDGPRRAGCTDSERIERKPFRVEQPNAFVDTGGARRLDERVH